ncbi:MAG: hypothetical protein ABJH82_00340 [Polaribacter sp.]|uniref:hypothetical protein n=1 Tax=Polaribacter sp. TaxID=1920175 RepID=UPI003264EA66
MRTNSFTNNMRLKSDAELEEILDKKNNYTEHAIQAVIWELENRNLIEKSESNYIETPIEIDIVSSNTISKPLEENESPFEDLEQPFLYSKKTIQGFTIFFTTIFGAILLMKNLKEMNKPKARIQVLVFGIVYTIFSAIILDILPKSFFMTLIFNLIGYAVLVEFFWNKHLGKNLKYRKKQIWLPLIISLAILFLMLFLLQFLPQIKEI